MLPALRIRTRIPKYAFRETAFNGYACRPKRAISLGSGEFKIEGVEILPEPARALLVNR
jgi:hypothetical protein